MTKEEIKELYKTYKIKPEHTCIWKNGDQHGLKICNEYFKDIVAKHTKAKLIRESTNFPLFTDEKVLKLIKFLKLKGGFDITCTNNDICYQVKNRGHKLPVKCSLWFETYEETLTFAYKQHFKSFVVNQMKGVVFSRKIIEWKVINIEFIFPTLTQGYNFSKLYNLDIVFCGYNQPLANIIYNQCSNTPYGAEKFIEDVCSFMSHKDDVGYKEVLEAVQQTQFELLEV